MKIQIPPPKRARRGISPHRQMDFHLDCNSKLVTDSRRMDSILTQTLEQAKEFLSSIYERPVGVRPDPGPIPPSPTRLPGQGVGAEEALKRFKEKYSASISASAGPSYFGRITGGSTPAALAGDWLASTFDQNAANSGDSCAQLVEKEVIHWMAQLLRLSEAHTGVFVSGKATANFVGLAIARQWIGLQHSPQVNVAIDGLHFLPKTKVLCSAYHSSIYKALSMLGLGQNSLETLPPMKESGSEAISLFREAISISHLRKALRACAAAGEVAIVVANAGTETTGDFDDLKAITKLKTQFNFWLHIDAVFGGLLACSNDFSGVVTGLDAGDSIAVAPHTWMNVPYDSGMVFTRHRKLQGEVFSGGILRSGFEDPDLVHLSPETSCRFRALPVWFSLTAYGDFGVSCIVDHCCSMAKVFGMQIAKSQFFKQLHPHINNVVCFTLGKGGRSKEEVRKFLEALNQKGKTFMTFTEFRGEPAIRAGFCNWRTRWEDMDMAWESMREIYQEGGFRRIKEDETYEESFPGH